MLGYKVSRLAEKAKLRTETIERAEQAEGNPNITLSNATAIQRALEAAGTEFTNGEGSGLRLRKRGAGE